MVLFRFPVLNVGKQASGVQTTQKNDIEAVSNGRNIQHKRSIGRWSTHGSGDVRSCFRMKSININAVTEIEKVNEWLEKIHKNLKKSKLAALSQKRPTMGFYPYIPDLATEKMNLIAENYSLDSI